MKPLLIAIMFLAMVGCASRHHLKLVDVQQLPAQARMPDPLVFNDGTRVRAAAQWQQRREELKKIVQHYLIGTAPPPPGNVRGTELDARELASGVQFRHVKLSF